MKALILLLAVLGISHAHACSPGQNIDVHFDRDSWELKSSQVLRLAEWDIQNRLRYPNHDFLQIAGIAQAEETNPKKLAAQRAEIVADFFRRTNYAKAEIIVGSHVYVDKPTLGESFQRTELMMAPLPPHACSK
ncbi:hypothetical protein QTI33_27670 [Variovorax sp. J22P271]|uniref:hypothetical protein n=1 Tax=Variovorax davisae TaxID=3053515 RepID=UPI002577C414|nr:hypothetical protein [Variovorax sp. J22P271]MDM0035943.1 hypothetical protein [Variovorax sp. J22P271]